MWTEPQKSKLHERNAVRAERRDQVHKCCGDLSSQFSVMTEQVARRSMMIKLSEHKQWHHFLLALSVTFLFNPLLFS